METIFDLFDKKLGFGLMRLPVLEDGTIDQKTVCEMADQYLEKGFRYFDTAYVYHSGTSEVALRECVVKRYPREKILIADKMPTFLVKAEEDYPKFFKEQQERCGVSYFDLYLLHCLDTENYAITEKYHGFDYAKTLKEEGKVRFLGFSFHDTPELLDEILTKYPFVDFVQLQINYYDWDNEKVQSGRCYEVAKKHNKPIIVMEPVKGGNLVNLPTDAKKLVEQLPDQVTPAQLAIRFAASLDQVAMVLSGMSTMDQLSENTDYMQHLKKLTSEEDSTVKKIVNLINEVDTIKCTACKYCVDGCPVHINIPGVFRVYNDMMQFSNGEVQPAKYQQVTKDKGKASECLKCGKCEGSCPQHLPIRDHLENIAKLYEA